MTGTLVADWLTNRFALDPGVLAGHLLTLALVAVAMAGYGMSWSAERRGAMLMLFAGAALGVLVLALGGAEFIAPALVYSLPFIVPGLLFAMSWALRRERQISASDLDLYRPD